MSVENGLNHQKKAELITADKMNSEELEALRLGLSVINKKIGEYLKKKYKSIFFPLFSAAAEGDKSAESLIEDEVRKLIDGGDKLLGEMVNNQKELLGELKSNARANQTKGN